MNSLGAKTSKQYRHATSNVSEFTSAIETCFDFWSQKATNHVPAKKEAEEEDDDVDLFGSEEVRMVLATSPSEN